MSATRHAQPDAPLSQERYMSSPEYAELRGLSASAVAAKAAMQTDPLARSLIFFIQALSLRPGAVNKVASDLLAMFPERIGTPAMHGFGMKPGQKYNAEQVKVVRDEVERSGALPKTDASVARDCYNEMAARAAERESGFAPRSESYCGRFPLKGEFEPAKLPESNGWRSDCAYDRLCEERDRENERRKLDALKHPAVYPAAVFVERCRQRLADALEKFLVELCINPAVHISGASLLYFHDIVGALLEFKVRHEQAARQSFAPTGASKMVHRTMERGLRSRKIVVANGVEGIGKSFSAQVWCEQHLGETRFVPLRGNQTETSFYSAVWVACGLGSPVNRKVQELRSRVDRFLEQSGIMLVVDEGHRLLPQSERIYSQPALMNWIYGLWDIRVPFALLVTPQFTSRMDQVERQTDWRSGQFKRRVECWADLPQKLAEDDLRGVARHLAANYTAQMIDELVDFALPVRRQLDAMARAISAATFIASEQGRAEPTARDLLAGIEEAQQTDLALTTRLDIERQTKASNGKPRRGRRSADADAPQRDCGETAEGSAEPGVDTLADTEAPPRTIIPLRAVTVPA